LASSIPPNPPANGSFILEIVIPEELLKKTLFVRNYAISEHCPKKQERYKDGRTPKVNSPAKPCK
jgi:hypothetical protein